MERKTAVLVGLLVVTLGVAVAVGPTSAGSVPDVRLTVSEVGVAPSEPKPGDDVDVEFTVENSGASTSAVTLDNATIRDREDGTEYARAENLGSLSAGDGTTVPLRTSFDSSGSADLEIVVRGTDESGDETNVTRPLPIDVESAVVDYDVEISATRLHAVETDDGDAQLGGVDDLLGGDEGTPDTVESTSLIELTVSNFGTPDARDVYVTPTVDGEELPRLTVEDVPPNASRTVTFDAERFEEPTTIDFAVSYRLGDADADRDRRSSSTTYEYDPELGAVAVTDLDVEYEGDIVRISGNVANVGDGDVENAVVELEETDAVVPTYPQKDYFVGTVPASDFVTFELTATGAVDNATTIPLTVSYDTEGVSDEQRYEIDGVDPDEADEGGSVLLRTMIGLGVAVSAIGASAYVWRRNGTNDRD